MILKYVKIEEDWDDLRNGSSIIFDLPTLKIDYYIYCGYGNYCWWLWSDKYANNKIFNVLEVDGESFVKSIVGYPCNGGFPEVKSLDDLKKVILALDAECIKKFGIPNSKSEPKFKVGDKVRILPRTKRAEAYSPCYLDGMEKFANRIDTILEITANSCFLKNTGLYYPLEVLRLIEDSDSKEEYIHPSKLKDGDFIKIRNGDHKGFICIFKEYKDNSIYRYVSLDLVDNSLDINSSRKWSIFSSFDKITYATEEEKKLLNEALLKEGYIWNNVAKRLQIVDTITINDSIGVIDIAEEHCVSSCVSAVNPCYIPSHPKYGVFVDTDKEELNLFPTKKHYQLNFNY